MIEVNAINGSCSWLSSWTQLEQCFSHLYYNDIMLLYYNELFLNSCPASLKKNILYLWQITDRASVAETKMLQKYTLIIYIHV